MGALNDCRFNYFDSLFRRFTAFTASDNDYIQMAQITDLVGDFEITFDYLRESTGTTDILLGVGNSNTPIIYVTSGDVLTFRDSANSATSVTGTTAGTLHNIRIVKTGTAIEVFVDGTSTTAGSSTGSFPFEYIGRRQAGNFLNGVIANVSMWTGGDSSTGTQVINMPLDRAYTDGAQVINYADDNNQGTAFSLVEADSPEYGFKVGTGWYEVQNPANILPVA